LQAEPAALESEKFEYNNGGRKRLPREVKTKSESAAVLGRRAKTTNSAPIFPVETKSEAAVVLGTRSKAAASAPVVPPRVKAQNPKAKSEAMVKSTARTTAALNSRRKARTTASSHIRRRPAREEAVQRAADKDRKRPPNTPNENKDPKRTDGWEAARKRSQDADPNDGRCLVFNNAEGPLDCAHMLASKTKIALVRPRSPLCIVCTSRRLAETATWQILVLQYVWYGLSRKKLHVDTRFNLFWRELFRSSSE
jgi:hypothetical protein